MITLPGVEFLFISAGLFICGLLLNKEDAEAREKRRQHMTPAERERDEKYDRISGDW